MFSEHVWERTHKSGPHPINISGLFSSNKDIFFLYRARVIIKIRKYMEVRCWLLNNIVLADSNLSVLLKREHSRKWTVIEWWKVFIFHSFLWRSDFIHAVAFHGSLIQPHSCQSDWWGWCLGVFKSVSPWALGQKSNEKFCETYWSISCWVQMHIIGRTSFQQKTLALHWWYSDFPWRVFAQSLLLVSFRWVTFTHSFGRNAYTGPHQTPTHAPPGTDEKPGLTSLRSPPS